jgi:hypothetical protein
MEKCNIEKIFDEKNIDNVIEEIKDCYYLFPDIKPIEISNVYDVSETCYLINNKKLEYYIHKYDPQKIIQRIRDYDIFINIKQDYITNLEEIADLTPKENCCNCVSFVLYYIYDPTSFNLDIIKEKNDLTPINLSIIIGLILNLNKYLYSLKNSVTNINKCLLDFISRIYLDISVFTFLFKIKKIIDIGLSKNDKSNKFIQLKDLYTLNIESIEFLFNNPSTEIYTILCKSYTPKIDQTRSLRFLPLKETDVNIKIIREADGYVSYIDCMNINNFVKSNTLMFVYDLKNYNRDTIDEPGNLLKENTLKIVLFTL